MKSRSSLTVGIALVISCLVLGLFFGRPFIGQPAAAEPPVSAGHYQLVVSNNTLYVFEPNTGQCWYHTNSSDGKWIDLGSPVIKTNKK